MKHKQSNNNNDEPEEIIIDDQIIKKASKCQKHFSCLKNISRECCKVIYCVNGMVHFIEGAENKTCDYKISFGFSFFCSCPVRKEIYNKYGI